MKTLLTLFRKNALFFLPLLLWLIAGGVLQIFFTHEELFLAINGAYNPVADVMMTVLTYVGDGITFGVLLIGILVAKRFRLFFAGLSIFLLVTVIVQIAKHYYDMPRPLAYFGDTGLVHMVSWVNVHSSNSFPSGHTATAFAMFCYLALVVNNKKWGFLFITFALLAAYSRIYLAQHFFMDVYAGSVIGSLSSILVYCLFEFRNNTLTPAVCPQQRASHLELAETKGGA
ncbi:phosphatase PAP2 family protein [Chitinophaga pendula]|uniref:phosphatase PAP2 family protein n=1 Tax=Chitinophaga TaxID=79328 RepID=UPI0012FDDCC1|nr:MULTISPECIES: phosphatase PAP2 family protein [Chitinophaga]UCJ06083.1 phosphatase PAP2 family protein [Chitinophaga pendula]